ALSALGERENGTERLREAIAAYYAALEEYTRERVPLKWAKTQDALGNALRTHGERENGTAQLKEAVNAYDSALCVLASPGLEFYGQKSRANRDRAIALLIERLGPNGNLLAAG